MTEFEWLPCEDPERMLRGVPGVLGERTALLFSVACCRLLAPLVTPERLTPRVRDALGGFDPAVLWVALDAAERFADDAATPAEYVAARNSIAVRLEPDLDLAGATLAERSLLRVLWYAVAAVGNCFWDAGTHPEVTANAVADAAAAAAPHDGWTPVVAADWARSAMADLLRDIAGNPFRAVEFRPQWRTSTAVQLAAGMYEAKDFSATPILADALQDAGCEDADVLDHCRRNSPGHVRGCWVVDRVLGKQSRRF